MTLLPLVSIIIPNWNGLRYLPACLGSLRALTYPNFEVIVADNASTDGSQAYIAEHNPEVRLLTLDRNYGFAGACNAGLKAAGGDILILLNNDTEVEPDWVSEVVSAFQRHPEAGSIASKMLLADRRDTLHTAGDLYRVDGMPANRGVWQPDSPEFNVECEVFSACGGSSAYRRTMLDDVGLLDEDFFFSCEDVDLGWRAQLRGWRAVYAPKAVVYHHLSATGGGPTASFYDGRNTLWVIARNYPSALLTKHLLAILSAQLRRTWAALRAWRGEAARATLRGQVAGLLSLPRVLRQRRAIQRGRTAPLAEIEARLTSTAQP